MNNHQPLEIERKFLIRMPKLSLLTAQGGIQIKEITQTYLSAPMGCTRRVRKSVTESSTVYKKTEKRRLSVLTAIEEEVTLSEKEYLVLLKEADPTRKPIYKTRYTFPFADHLIEIDVYPFWQDRAILEIELSSETESYEIPPFLTVVREVSDDKRYKNVNLAKEIVTEPLA